MRLEVVSACVPDEERERRPLSALDEEETHVHGELRWSIDGRMVPRRGYFGPDDACLGEWWDGLDEVIEALTTSNRFQLEIGDQGSSAFLFERDGTQVELSIVESYIFGGLADPAWQRVSFAWVDFIEAVRAFQRQLRDRLFDEGPVTLPRVWLRRIADLGAVRAR